jgi:hypothetical protein
MGRPSNLRVSQRSRMADVRAVNPNNGYVPLQKKDTEDEMALHQVSVGKPQLSCSCSYLLATAELIPCKKP